MFLKPKHFIFECRPNFGSFYPLPGLLRAITFSAPKPPTLQISAYATGLRIRLTLIKCLILAEMKAKVLVSLKFISSSSTIRGKSTFNKYNKRRNIFFKEKLVTRRFVH